MYGDKLKQLRKIEGWTIEEVAKKIGVSKQTYSHYEHENRRPSLPMIRELAAVYQVNIDAIFAEDVETPNQLDNGKRVESNNELVNGIKNILDKHNMDLSDPKSLELLDSALDLLKRMRNE